MWPTGGILKREMPRMISVLLRESRKGFSGFRTFLHVWSGSPRPKSQRNSELHRAGDPHWSGWRLLTGSLLPGEHRGTPAVCCWLVCGPRRHGPVFRVPGRSLLLDWLLRLPQSGVSSRALLCQRYTSATPVPMPTRNIQPPAPRHLT